MPSSGSYLYQNSPNGNTSLNAAHKMAGTTFRVQFSEAILFVPNNIWQIMLSDTYDIYRI